ncbi:hypothetical protein BJ875DRAFT_78325 [Amylocarpus encephaloides]|uniref:Uncharacterized protein n=1 Tax=Amylocarpus encephaloides TaxID=45428 RepID=A0A9P8C3T5_9HELO|nr:hypothetical protein BJ875DRAFT_78325 [Amylocarpus encephaloides]
MTWLTTISNVLSYFFLPLKLFFQGLLILLSPVKCLGSYVVAGALLPLGIFAKFETLYIYLGVAAIVGLATGSILHFSSTALVSFLHMIPSPQQRGQTAVSVRPNREEQQSDDAPNTSESSNNTDALATQALPAIRIQASWLELNRSRRRQKQGLLSQTILEEDESEAE